MANLTNQMVLGNTPQNLWMIVSPNAVWNPTITAQSAPGITVDWPSGTTATLILTDSAFTLSLSATVTGPDLMWNVSAATVNTIPDGCLAQIYLDQSGSGIAPTLWFSGTLSVRS